MIGQSCIRGRGQSGASATGCLQIKKLGGRESTGKWAADSPAKGSIFTSVSRAERKVTPAVQQQVWGKQRAPRRGRAAFIILTSTGNPTQPTSPTPTQPSTRRTENIPSLRYLTNPTNILTDRSVLEDRFLQPLQLALTPQHRQSCVA